MMVDDGLELRVGDALVMVAFSPIDLAKKELQRDGQRMFVSLMFGWRQWWWFDEKFFLLEISESIKIITRKCKPICCLLWSMFVEPMKVLQVLDHVSGAKVKVTR